MGAARRVDHGMTVTHIFHKYVLMSRGCNAAGSLAKGESRGVVYSSLNQPSICAWDFMMA